MFQNWYNKYEGKKNLIKIDNEIELVGDSGDYKSKKIYTTLIFHKRNSDADKLQNFFENLQSNIDNFYDKNES